PSANMSNTSMPSGITRGRATSCFSLAIQTSTARGPCNAASDWVGSCAITIKRQRDRTPKVPSRTLTPRCDRAIEEAAADALLAVVPTPALRKLATSCQLQVLPPFQFFDHTGRSVPDKSPWRHACGPFVAVQRWAQEKGPALP